MLGACKLDMAQWPEYLRSKLNGMWRERLEYFVIMKEMGYGEMKIKLLAAGRLTARDTGVVTFEKRLIQLHTCQR